MYFSSTLGSYQTTNTFYSPMLTSMTTSFQSLINPNLTDRQTQPALLDLQSNKHKASTTDILVGTGGWIFVLFILSHLVAVVNTKAESATGILMAHNSTCALV
jgi:hypothetical protein